MSRQITFDKQFMSVSDAYKQMLTEDVELVDPKVYGYKLSVDAGNMSIIDKDVIIKNGGQPNSELCKKMALEPETKYRVKLIVDSKETSFEFNTISGIVYVGDCGYHWTTKLGLHQEWLGFLEKTGNLEKNEVGFKSVSTGGDGIFDVTIEIEKAE